MTNSGGIRSRLSPSNYPAGSAADRDLVYPDDIVVGDLFALHNFGNRLSRQVITGQKLWAALEQGVAVVPNGRFPQIAGFQVIYNTSNAAGARVLSVTLDNGTAVPNDTSQTYRLATMDFISAGGDGYTTLADPSAASFGLLTTALQDYISAQPGVINPYFDCRMVDQNATGPATTRAANPLGPFALRADCS